MNGNKEIGKGKAGSGASIMQTHLGQQEIYTDILKKIKQQSLINIQEWTLNLNWSDIKELTLPFL